MKSVYSTINSISFSDSPVKRLNRTLFLQACRFSMVAGTVFWLIVVFMKLPFILWFCCLTPAITSGVLYFKYNENVVIASQIFYIVHLAGLSIGFFFNGGSRGTVLFILFVLINVILFLAPQKHVFFVSTTIITALGILGLEYFFKDRVIYPYLSDRHRIVDIAIAWSTSLFMCSWVLVFARKAYETEKNRTQQADIAKSKFLATMSHEIRTPLNAIVGLNSLALDKTHHDPVLHNYLEEVGRSSEHLLSIINDILDFSKIEAGQMELDVNRFSLEELVHHLDQTFKIICKQKSIQFELVFPKEFKELMLLGDVQRIRQILYNLLSNACKFTIRGKVTLELTSLESKPSVKKLQFKVKDTGVGIPKGRIDALFSDYNQGASSVSSKFGGTGLGLAISKRLVQMMNGTISVESVEGQGSEFILDVELKIDSKFRPISLEKGLNRELLPGLKVLVVEDNLVNQKLLKILLEKKKVEFQVASNGEEALVELKNRIFDLVLMDIEMPIMDGFTATEALRAGKAGVLNQFIPVVALTAHAIIEMRKKGTEVGMNYYLTKPLRPNDLYKTLAEIQHGSGDFTN